MKLIIFGPPGSGKSTIAKMFRLVYISSGKIFRYELKQKTKLGIEAYKKYWGKGNLVPDNITLKIITKVIKRARNNFIIDGFPRTIKQAQELTKVCDIDYVIVLEVPYNFLKERLLKRAKIEGRRDDTPETIKQRFKVYKKQTEPVLKYYKDKIIKINANRKPKNIEKEIVKILKNANRSFKAKS